jgi:hypothetical protein
MDERDIRWKSDKMVGADDGSANPSWWLTKTHEYPSDASPLIIAQLIIHLINMVHLMMVVQHT